jgi:hypothetical protein
MFRSYFSTGSDKHRIEYLADILSIGFEAKQLDDPATFQTAPTCSGAADLESRSLKEHINQGKRKDNQS